MSAYLNAINQVQLFGPTNFSPVINHVAKFASAYQVGSLSLSLFIYLLYLPLISSFFASLSYSLFLPVNYLFSNNFLNQFVLIIHYETTNKVLY